MPIKYSNTQIFLRFTFSKTEEISTFGPPSFFGAHTIKTHLLTPEEYRLVHSEETPLNLSNKRFKQEILDTEN